MALAAQSMQKAPDHVDPQSWCNRCRASMASRVVPSTFQHLPGSLARMRKLNQRFQFCPDGKGPSSVQPVNVTAHCLGSSCPSACGPSCSSACGPVLTPAVSCVQRRTSSTPELTSTACVWLAQRRPSALLRTAWLSAQAVTALPS